MRRKVASMDLFETIHDINGKPIPRWQERLEQLYTAYVPFGEILSFVRYLLEERDIDLLLNAPDERVLASVADPEKLAADMRSLFEEAVRRSRAESN